MHPEVEQNLEVTFTTTLLLCHVSFCWLLTKIFYFFEGKEAMAGEDVTFLQERITGK